MAKERKGGSKGNASSSQARAASSQMGGKVAGIVAVVAIVAALALGSGVLAPDETGSGNSSSASTPAAAVDSSSSVSQDSASSGQASDPSYTFRSKSQLNEHYKKHGKEMGFASAQDYLAAANAVIGNPDALHKTQREDGDDVYYLQATDELVIVSTDGFIRTYFNPGGIAYYNKQ